MNTINSASNTSPVSDASTGEHAVEASDPSAVEVLKALLEKPSGMQAGSDDLLSDDDQPSGPDWSLMEGLVAPAMPVGIQGGAVLAADDQIQPGTVLSGGSASTWTNTAATAGAVVTPDRLNDFASDALKALVKVKTEDAAPASAGAADASAAVGSADTLGSAILDSFFSQSSSSVSPLASPAQAAGAEVPSPGPVAERVAKIEDLMHTMLDRVLVTDPLASQNQEVRIKFQDAVLPGTEARVWREDGRVMVEFVSTKAESVRWLEGSIAMLSQRLDERLTHTAPSLVTVNSSGDAPSDGRSRERNTPWDQARQHQQQQEEATA